MPGSPTGTSERGHGRPTRVLIMGAAGRDFHNFNVVFRDNKAYEVAAFTAAQIPDIAGRRYPAALAGPLYPDGIAIHSEEQLPELIRRLGIDQVCLSYSDLPHVEVMHKASTALACGADFVLLGPKSTMLNSRRPVISVCAVRTGTGKSPASRRIVRWLAGRGHKVAVVRHPMPYGDLEAQAAQRFATYEDLDAARTTIEEREEYEPYVRMGIPVFAGVDYERILRCAEGEAEVVLWDGGNNDFPFFKPDLHIVLLDPQRAGHELAYHPGETNLRMADILVITKANSASEEQIEQVIENAKRTNPRAALVVSDMVLKVDRPELIDGKRALIVGDGPTLTHGGMSSGAGTAAATRWGAREIVSGRDFAAGSIKAAYQEFPHLSFEVPAMGYTAQQVKDLEATVNNADADVVVDGSPVDLAKMLNVNKPIVNVGYELEERGPLLSALLERFEERFLKAQPALPRGSAGAILSS